MEGNPMKMLSRCLKRHPLAIYFTLTLGIVWVTAPLAIFSPAGHGMLNAFTPMLIAMLITFVSAGAPGIHALVCRLLQWRVGLRWYAVVLGLPVAIGSATLGLSALLGLPIVSPIVRIPVTTLTFLALIWIIAPGEELGWRGFALPHLLARHPALVSSLVLGLVGVAFHLSAYLIPLLIPSHAAPGMPFLTFLLQYLAYTIIVTWLVIQTEGSVLIACLFHGAVDITGNLVLIALDSAVGPWIWSGVTVLVAVLIVASLGPDLGRRAATQTMLATTTPNNI
jgi:membrane protease YdiL (CAAX protease family)